MKSDDQQKTQVISNSIFAFPLVESSTTPQAPRIDTQQTCLQEKRQDKLETEQPVKRVNAETPSLEKGILDTATQPQ